MSGMKRVSPQLEGSGQTSIILLSASVLARVGVLMGVVISPPHPITATRE